MTVQCFCLLLNTYYHTLEGVRKLCLKTCLKILDYPFKEAAILCIFFLNYDDSVST